METLTNEYQYVYDNITGECVYTCWIKDGKMYFFKFDELDKALYYMEIK